MLKRRVILLLLSLQAAVSYSQSPDKANVDSSFHINRGVNLLYYVDNSFNSNQFLIPFIETELKQMGDKYDKQRRKLFSSVDGINYYVSADSASNKVALFFDMFRKVDPKFNERIEARDSSIFNRIKKAQFFLKININAFNNLLEYQFVLVKIEVGAGNDDNFFQLSNYRTASTFIDPNSQDYKTKLRNCLHQLIAETNEQPIPVVYHDNEIINDDATVYTAPGLFTLQADATDSDSDPEQLRYKWTISHLKDGRSWSDVLSVENRKLQVNITDTGTFFIDLLVSDGVNFIPRSYWVISKPPPSLSISASDKAPLFYNGTLFLYSFHRKFKDNDFSSLFRKVKEVTAPVYDNQNWTLLKSKLQVNSTVWDSRRISFYQIRFDKIADSIVNYREIPSGMSLFRFQPSPFSPKDLLGPFYFDVLMNVKPEENIVAPSTHYFKATVDDNGVKSSYNFNIQIAKISRFSPYAHLSEILYYIHGSKITFTQVGLGLEYLVSEELSVNGAVGTSTSKSFRSPVEPFYRIGGSLNLYDYRSIVTLRFSAVGLYKQTHTYDPPVFDSNSQKNIIKSYYNGYKLRVGFGGELNMGFTNSEYHAISISEFLTYYPKGYSLNSFIETGIILKFLFKNSR
jgi:hypothetical protein